MTKFPVSEAKEKDLLERMARLGLREEDLTEDFTRGSGAGGQKINKTSVVVLLRHAKSGLEVRCQESRSQALNRFIARRLLVEKLEEKIFQRESAKRQEIEKLRRQKRKRSKRAKEKMLDGKKRQGEKKKSRKKGFEY
jgi:protein subunit release factor B